MKTIVFVLIGLISIPSFAALSCKHIEKKKDADGALTYFKDREDLKVPKKIDSKIIRQAVADYYGECGKTWNDDYCYKTSMTDAEVLELGEDPYTEVKVTPAGKVYHSVNVGFGGGNSAVYFFDPQKNHYMEKIMILDGFDCSPIKSILGYK